MKSKELRLGNYVSVFSVIGKVTEIKNNQILVLAKSLVNDIKVEYYYEIGFINSIPITNDLLINAGAKYINEYWYEFHTYGIIKHKSFIEFYSSVKGDYICNSVKYLHELQNIYFALTGSELVFSTEP